MANHLPCGIELPQVFFDGPVDMDHVRKFAARAETLGYDSLWLQERIVGDFPMLEPVTLLSYVAAITAKLKLGTSVILLPLRNPLQLAKAYSTLYSRAQLSHRIFFLASLGISTAMKSFTALGQCESACG